MTVAAPRQRAPDRDDDLRPVWELAERVVGDWQLERPVVKLLEHKKNVTFKVEETAGARNRYVLRVCDPDGYGEAEIRSELRYLLALHQATGLVVPEPVRTRDGALLGRGEHAGLARPRWCALFRWVPGRMVEDTPAPALLERVGEISARLHAFSGEWLPPADFRRPRWDAAGLFGSGDAGGGAVLPAGQGAPLVGDRARELVEEGAAVVRAAMRDLGEGRDVFGLIHKDLEPDNTLVDGDRVHAIDFADLGWGHFLYDIAASLLPLREKAGFAAMRQAFLRGYRRVRPLAAEHEALLETFLIARGIFSLRLMTGRLWDLPQIRLYAETAVPQILGGIRVFLARRRAEAAGRPATAAGSTQTTVQYLAVLRSRGVKLWVEGDRLRYSAPRQVATAELLAELKERKQELLGFLAQGQAARRLGAPVALAAAGLERPPLSFAQQRLWFIHQLLPASTEYNIARAVRLRGAVRVGVLAASLREIVRRHAVLRTTFALHDGQPVQVIAAAGRVPLPLVDLGALPLERREPAAWGLALADAARPFDLARGPLLRVCLLRLSATDFIAPSTMHHVIGDGWSSAVLFRELGAVYAAVARGAPSPLPELPLQYADFAVWQRQWLAGDVLAEQLDFWRGQLAGAPPVLALPADRPHPPVAAAAGAPGDRRALLIPQPLAAALKTFSQAQGATLFMILLAGFKTLLCRICGQDDVVVGSPIANRNRTEIEGLIGFFANTLVLRTVFTGDPTFREVLGSVRQTTLGAYAHQDLPFEKIVEELRPERDLTQTPLFQVIFTFQNVPYPDMDVADFHMTLMPPTGRAAMFDLTCNMKEMPEGVRTSFMYRQDRFDGATVERFAGWYLRLLETVAADPHQRIRELPLLSAAETHQLLREWNDTAAERGGAADCYAWIAAQAARTPDAVAVAAERRQVTYGELLAQAERLAARLRRLGVGPEVRVGIVAERSAAMVIGIVGVLAAGGAYVPLDPDQPRQRLAFMLADAAAPVLLIEERLHGVLAPPAGMAVVELQDEGADAPAAGSAPAVGEAAAGTAGTKGAVDAAGAAYVIYTSGSTGRPKGAVNSAGALANRIQWMQDQYGLTAADAVLQKTPFGFDVSVWEFLWPLATGARLVMARPGGHLDPAYLRRLIVEEGITTLHFVPSMLQVFLAQDGLLECRSLRRVMASGEALPADLALRCTRWLQQLAAGEPAAALHNLYGPTEAAIDVTSWRCDADAVSEPVPIGRPIANLRLRVLDRELRPVGVGVAGELCIGGQGVARGYWGRPELTAERFVPDPLAEDAPGERLYRTGDLARWRHGGQVEYLGRIDFQVKVRGVRIEPGEIEAALAAHPAVRQAAVLARPAARDAPPGPASPGAGEGAAAGPRLVAYLVTGEPAPGAAELRAFLRRTLPEAMVPQAFVALAVLPVGPNGKLDRKALAALPLGEVDGAVAARGPRSAVEEIVADLFREVLGRDQVGVDAGFFEMGGHSLLAVRLVAQVRRVFAVELPVRAVFDAPTVATLAARIEAALRQGAPPLPPLVPRRLAAAGASRPPQPADTSWPSQPADLSLPRPPTTAPLSFAQERLWFLDQLEPGTALYNMPAALRLRGPWQPAILRRAFAEVVRRHETLRTRFVPGPPPAAELIAGGVMPLPWIDLSGVPAASATARAWRELERLAGEEARQPFDLARGPRDPASAGGPPRPAGLLRVRLVRLAADDQALLVTVHHTVADGLSLGVLVRELAALYQAFAAGAPSPLPELPIQYGDYAAWQRSWLAGERLEREVEQWRERLAGAPPLLALPLDRQRPAVASHRGGSVPVRLRPALRAALAALASRHGATVFMTLLAGLRTLLARAAGERDVVVGTAVGGRSHVETEGLIGLFVNTLVLRTDCGGNPDVAGLLARERETTLWAYGHADLPFEKLVEALAPRRSLAHSPIFQVMLVFQQDPLGAGAVAVEPLGAGTRAAGSVVPVTRATGFPTAEPAAVASLTAEAMSVGASQGGLEHLAMRSDSAKFDLSLALSHDLTGTLTFASDLFDRATVLRWSESLALLLEGMAADPGAPVMQLPVLAAGERAQLIHQWNDTAVALPPLLLHDLVAAQVARTPDAIAAEFDDRCMSYAELGFQAAGRARSLRELGVGIDTPVAVAAERDPDVVVALLAVLTVGGVCLPLDPALPDHRLREMTTAAGTTLLLAQESLRDRCEPFCPQVLALDGPVRTERTSARGDWVAKPGGVDGAARQTNRGTAGVVAVDTGQVAADAGARETSQMAGDAAASKTGQDAADAAAGKTAQVAADGATGETGQGAADMGDTAAQRTRVTADGDALAYILYTSGSTGRPKGVGLSHRALVNRLLWAQAEYPLRPDDRVLQIAGCGFDFAVWETFAPLIAGARLVLARPGGQQDPAYLVATLRERGITIAHFIPSMLQLVLDEPGLSACTGLRHLFSGGEALPAALRDRTLAVVPGAILWNQYGPTEATVDATFHRCGGGGRVDDQGAGLPATAAAECCGVASDAWTVPIGGPVANTQVHLLDGGLRPVPIGWPGEIHIGGTALARGYLGQADWTAERFVPDPFAGEPGGRLYRSGDQARRRADGAIEFVGRADRQVKVRGFRVELGEVEAALAALAGVCEAAVVAPGGERLVACVVAEGATVGELRRALAQRLPAAMVPAAFVLLPSLPRTPNGKVDRRALAALLADAPPTPGEPGAPAVPGDIAPRSPAEELLAGLFGQLLGRADVGVQDDFFELGGHSLLAVRLVAQVRHVFGVELGVRSVFEAPTVAALAVRVEQAARLDRPAPPPLVRVPRPAPPPHAGGAPAPAAATVVPLSFAQERLWFLEQLEPGTAQYNIPAALRLRGSVSPAVLARAFTEVVRRHEVLRSRFVATDPPAAEVAPAAALPLPLIDLGGLAAAPSAAGRELARLAREEARRPFDLARGPRAEASAGRPPRPAGRAEASAGGPPRSAGRAEASAGWPPRPEGLLRARLVQLGPADRVLLCTLHHAVADGASLGVLVREVSALYATFAAGLPPALAELPVQYGDYAAWQRSWLAGERLEREVEGWRERLAGAPPVVALPLDRQRPAVASHRGASLAVRLRPELRQALAAAGRRHGATLFMTVLAGFQALLARCGGERDVVVGTPVAGRSHLELEGLIGLFVNTLALRTDLTGQPGVGQTLARAREAALWAYGHAELPFERLVEALAPQRSLAHAPLVQAMLSLEEEPPGTLRLGDVQATALQVHSATAKLDLLLALGGDLTGSIEYATDLFDRATIERFVRHLERLLGGVAADAPGPLAELPLLEEAEQAQLLREWNDTAAPAGEGCLHEMFAAQAARTPAAVAVAVAGGERLTYAGLAARVAALAEVLRGHGVGPEVRVGVLLPRDADLLVTLLAVLQAGGAYVGLDPAYPRPRLAWMVQDSAAALVVTRGGLAALVAGSGAPVVRLEALAALAGGTGSAGVAAPAAAGADAAAVAGAPRAAVPQNLAYLIYTSGSTGRPKAVGIEHRSAVALVAWAQRTYAAAELASVAATTSVCFDLSVFELFVPLATGGRVVLLADALALAGLPADDAVTGVTLLNTVPSAVAALVQAGSLPPSVRTVNLAGEALSGSLADRLYGAAAVARVVNLYGPSEDTTYSTCKEVARQRPGEPTIGRPLDNRHARVLDAAGLAVAPGIAGELCLGGRGLARGYLGRPDLTADRFVPDAWGGEPGARLYRTGDLARHRPDGELEFLGRRDHQVKVRGFRIELGEVEAALAALPGVREAAVVAAPESDRLVAYVVTDHTAGATPTAAAAAGDLRRALAARLPAALVPAAIAFSAALPRTPNGKVDRKALAAAAPGAAAGGGGLPLAPAAPRDELELALHGVWEEVLGARGAIGIRDHFFDLGGHSLLAVRLVARVRQRLGAQISLASLFVDGTVERQAALLRQGGGMPAGAAAAGAPARSLVQVRAGGGTPPFVCVHPVGGSVLCYFELARRLDAATPSGRPFWGLQAPPAPPALQPAAISVEEMADRYLAELRAAQPDGPYLLGGWSMGALVAFEMARRLRQAGRPVAALVLLDPPPAARPSGAAAPAELEPAQASIALLASFARDLAALGGLEAPGVAADLERPEQLAETLRAATDADDAVRRLCAWARRTGALPSYVGDGLVRELSQVFLANLAAARAYRPAVYDGACDLLLAAGTADASSAGSASGGTGAAADLSRGWARYATGGVRITAVPGGHYGLLRQPDAACWAAALAQALSTSL